MKTRRLKKWVKVAIVFMAIEMLLSVAFITTNGVISVACLLGIMPVISKGINWVF